MHEPLKNRTYLGKKLPFHFLGADFLAPKSSHRCENQPVLGPVCHLPYIIIKCNLVIWINFIKSQMFLTSSMLLNFRWPIDLGSKTFLHFANAFRKGNSISDLATLKPWRSFKNILSHQKEEQKKRYCIIS